MDIKDFAKQLNDRHMVYDYPQFTKEELQIARENNFVIVSGASDDLMEFEGAIYDEGGCYDGGRVYFNKSGMIDKEDATQDDMYIDAIWCGREAKDENGNIITWTYETDIPHETFYIYDDENTDKIYCRAIVFMLS